VSVEVNCDMGEGFGLYRLGDDAGIMPHITLANVACGFHGGDPAIMCRTVALAKARGVRVGAHPSYPDRQGFGRRAMALQPEELEALLVYQVGALKAFLDLEGMALAHVKVHGALYGAAARDRAVAEAIGAVADAFGVPLLGMAGTLHEEVWGARPAGFLAEYYADLDYADDGSLVITREHVAYDPEEAARGAVRAVREGVATTASGKEIPMRADCVCVHSDTPGAVELARAVSEALRALPVGS